MDPKKITLIIFSTLLILLILIAIILLIILPKLISPSKRLSSCLSTFNNYFIINQQPIPNNGKYYNEFFKSYKYYGLRDFFYASSYKSYLPCGNTNDLVSYNALKYVLLKGARVINLDIFYKGLFPFEDNAKIIVGNVIDNKLSFLPGAPEKLQYLEFASCLQLIKELAWVKTDAPLILYLNLEFLPNQKLEYQIFSQLSSILPQFFLDKYYGFQRVNLGNIPINKASNRIIIVTNRKPIDGFLNEITNGVLSNNSVNIILYKITQKDTEYGGVKIHFPTKEKAIQTTSQNLVAVIKENDINPNNVDSPKIDTTNYDTSSQFELGVSISFMNWQNYPDKNDYMLKYLENFKNGGLILKPQNLIYVPKPPPPSYQRDTTFDYTNRNITGLKGFYNFNV